MTDREYTCIVCPEGCAITAGVENGAVVSVRGNKCPRGDRYVRTEAVAPVRNISSTVAVTGGERCVVSVKTASPIPKEKIFDCMAEIRALCVCAPVLAGQVLLKSSAGADIVATGTVLSAK